MTQIHALKKISHKTGFIQSMTLTKDCTLRIITQLRAGCLVRMRSPVRIWLSAPLKPVRNGRFSSCFGHFPAFTASKSFNPMTSSVFPSVIRQFDMLENPCPIRLFVLFLRQPAVSWRLNHTLFRWRSMHQWLRCDLCRNASKSSAVWNVRASSEQVSNHASQRKYLWRQSSGTVSE